MGLRINTNVQSLIAQNSLSKNSEALKQTQQRLSTGTRIVSAKDDAAGLAISENLRAVRRSTIENIRNAQNGFLLLQTADGALNEISNIIMRMKELAVQAASDTNGNNERKYLNNEYQALKAEIDRISNATLFNGRPLLNGQGGEFEIQIGPNNRPGIDRIKVSSDFHIMTSTLALEELKISTADGARESLTPINTALERLASVRADIGASESRLSTTINALQQYEENTAAASSQIRDADLAYETAELAKNNILTQAGVAVLLQANNSPNLALKLLGN